MARQLRVEFEHAFYHVTSRGNLRGEVFFDDGDREHFLKILRRTKERYSFLLHAYALMDNHYHLLMETPKANLSKIMQNINTSYTVYINRKYGRTGHLFQGRFKAIIVDKDGYLVALSRYIHLNPGRAGLVKVPGEYRWTSYRAFMEGEVGQSLVDTADTLSYFSKRRRRAIVAYREFVERDERRNENAFEKVEAGVLLGNGRFRAKIRNLIEKLEGDEEIPQARRLRNEVPIDAVVDACASFYAMSKDELLRRGKGKQERQVAVYLSRVFSGRSGKEIGRYFGIKGPAVSGIIKGIEARVHKEKNLRDEIERLRQKMTNEF